MLILYHLISSHLSSQVDDKYKEVVTLLHFTIVWPINISISYASSHLPFLLLFKNLYKNLT